MRGHRRYDAVMESIVDLVVPWLVGGLALCVLSAFALTPVMAVTGIYAWLGAMQSRREADEMERLLTEAEEPG